MPDEYTVMREILGKAKSVRELLKGVKYSIDYYQREYKWQDKQLRELIDDLASKFLEDYQPGQDRKRVAEYPHYFLGSIIISKNYSPTANMRSVGGWSGTSHGAPPVAAKRSPPA